MNITTYRQQIHNHDFVHQTSRYFSRGKLRKKPDPSCLICYPLENKPIPNYFIRFWSWFSKYYNAKAYNGNTTSLFYKAYLKGNTGGFEFEQALENLITSIRYYNHTPSREFDLIVADLSITWQETHGFQNYTPSITNLHTPNMSQQGDNNQPQPQVIINNNARNNNGNAKAGSRTSSRLHIHDDLSENNIEPGQRTPPEQVEEPVEEPQQEEEEHEPTPEEMLIKLLQGLTTVLDKRKDTKEVKLSITLPLKEEMKILLLG